MRARIPRSISPSIIALCCDVDARETPRFVECQPSTGGPFDECFTLVEQWADLHGGAPQYGWAIWEWPGVLVEAEFHAVWADSKGTLLDIVPRPEPIRQILFLPDTRRVYEGRQVNNVRRPLTPAPEVRELIALYEKRFQLLNAGERATQHQVELEGDEVLEFARIDHRLQQIQATLNREQRVGRNDPCTCLSGKKFKKCCGA